VFVCISEIERIPSICWWKGRPPELRSSSGINSGTVKYRRGIYRRSWRLHVSRLRGGSGERCSSATVTAGRDRDLFRTNKYNQTGEANSRAPEAKLNSPREIRPTYHNNNRRTLNRTTLFTYFENIPPTRVHRGEHSIYLMCARLNPRSALLRRTNRKW
jgi:hypothetical protein